MNTNDNEATMLQNNNDEATQIVDNTNATSDKTQKIEKGTSPTSEVNKSKHKSLKKVAGFAGAGILLGSASPFVIDVNGAQSDDTSADGIALDGRIPEEISSISSSIINDDMTFDEAFAEARETMGPGAAFEWQGNVYATFTKEEWDAMTDDEKSDFYSGLSIDNPYDQSENIEITEEDGMNFTEGTVESESQETTTSQEVPIDIELEGYPNNADEDDIVIVTEGESDNTTTEDSEIEIIGVYHDEESGANIGAINVDGQDLFMIDGDGDMVFDSIYADINNDGNIDNSEIMDISNDELSVDDIGGFSDSTDNMFLSNEEGPDYFSETYDDDIIA